MAEAAVPAVGSPQSGPVASTPPATSTSKPASTAPASGGGGFLVQLGAFTSEDQAHSHATQIVGKHADLLNGLNQDIQRADLGAKGVYYRLRFGPFGSRKDATDKCSALKSEGQECVVIAGT
jgi:cell division protein FtsN